MFLVECGDRRGNFKIRRRNAREMREITGGGAQVLFEEGPLQQPNDWFLNDLLKASQPYRDIRKVNVLQNLAIKLDASPRP